MARVPGLVSVGQERPNGKPLKSRVATPDASQLRPAQLQPVAAPVDTYVRPSQAPAGNRMNSLAEALSSINPAIQRFMAVKAEDNKDLAADALAVVQQTDPTELSARMRAGDVPAEFQNLEGMRVWAEAKAYQDAQEMTRRYNEGFDKDNGDVNALFREVTAESMDNWGKDRAFLEVYTGIIEKQRQSLIGAQTEYTSTKVLTERADTVYSAWYGRVETMAAEGTPPADIASTLFTDMKKNKDFLLLPYKDQQKMLLQIADQQATKGNFDVAKAILAQERVDGAYRGSLMSDREIGEQASTLYARIEKDQLDARLEVQAVEAEEQVYAEAHRRVLDGSITAVTDATIPGPDGKPKTIPSSEILKQAAIRERALVNQEAQARGITDPARIRLEEKKRFVGSGLEHPEWFTVMNTGYTQASVNNVTGAELPTTLVDGFTTYKDLYKDSPQYLAAHMEAKAMDFYDVARVLRETGISATDEDALRAAQLVTRNPGERDSNTNARFDQIDAAVSAAIGNSSGWFTGPAKAGNGGYVRDQITRTAKLLGRAQVPMDRALAEAQKLFEGTHVNIEGTYIRTDKRMPGDFQTLAGQMLDEYATANGIDRDDITIAEASNGTGGYYIALKSTYMPAGSGTDMFFNLEDILTLRQRNRDTVITGVVENANN